MRLGTGRAGFGAAGDDLHQVSEQPSEDVLNLSEGGQGAGEPALPAGFQGFAGGGAVRPVGRGGRAAGTGDRFGCGGAGREGIEIVADHLGAEILLGGQPGEAGHLFQGQPMLDALKRLLDAPAGVVEGAEVGGGKRLGIEQRGHQHLDPAGRGEDPDQTPGGGHSRHAIIGGIAGGGWRQVDHRLGLARAQEAPHRGKAGGVDPQTEGAAEGEQGRHQPAGRIAPIQHQEVISAERWQMLEQHLPLPDRGRIEFEVQRQFQTGQVEQKRDRLPDLPAGGILAEQAEFRRIGGHHPETLPARDGEVLFHEADERRVEAPEHRGREALASFGKGLGRDLTVRKG